MAPSGTVTFLFTDIEGSTRLWEEAPEAMRTALGRHGDLLRAAIDRHGGYVFSTAGDGLAAAFQRAADAVSAAVAAQRALVAEPWPEGATVRVRMGLHTGEAEERDGDYFGAPLNRAARLMAAAHGGQVVVSDVTAGLLAGTPGFVLVDLGLHRLRGLIEPIRVYGVHADGLAPVDRPLTTQDTMRGNLPHPLTEWFGPVDELRSRVADLTTRRLVTLTGPGGVGKTRLATEMGALVGGDYPDGVWIVELAPVADPDAVEAAVASALGVVPQQGMTTLESVLEWLQGRRLLLVLDNCEHVLAPVAAVAAAIISAEEAVTVLATSREPLGTPGERVVPVPPLGANDAVALFCDRAAALDASVAFSPDDQATIGAICSRLDGVPLAIELAAARSRSLGPADLLARLDDRFRLLRGGGRGALERHQTLRATVSWSYQLLSAGEQALFDRLSVFAGGFDLPSAELVCGFDPIDAVDVLDLLGALVDKSLVIADRAPGTARYRLLETLRQYGEERLEERGETLAARDRHLAHYVGTARRAYGLWLSERYREGAATFDREWDNLRAAHATALTVGDLTGGEALLDAMYAPALHEQRPEYLDWAERTLAAAKVAGRHTAATYGQAASFLYRLGNHGQAVEVATAGLGAPGPDPRGEIICLTYLLAALGQQHRAEEALAAAARLDALLATGTDDPFLMAVALTTIVSFASFTGASAGLQLARLEDLATSTGAPPVQELAALSRGLLLRGQSPPDLEGALAAFRRGVDVARRTASATLAGANLYGVANCSVRLGLSTAHDACREALVHSYEARHWVLTWLCLGMVAFELATDGELEPANVIHGHVVGRLPPTVDRGEDIEPLLAGPRADLWRAEGAAMDRHELVRYALARLAPDGATAANAQLSW